ASSRNSYPCPLSLTRNHPESGILTSLGKGMQALSIAIRKTTPGHPMASYRSLASLTIVSSIPSRGPTSLSSPSVKYKRVYFIPGSVAFTAEPGRSRVKDDPVPMDVGKLPHDLLASLLERIHVHDPRVLVGPGIGCDAAVIDNGAPRLLVAKR